MIHSTHHEVRAVQYEILVGIDAPTARVWRALTTDLNEWWLPPFHVLGPGSVISIDANAGGGMIERTSSSSLLWCTVIEATKEQSLTMAGYLTPRWGGPCSTLLTYTLAPRGQSTDLTLQDALYGHVSDKLVESLHAGWMQLMHKGLKPYCEANC